MQNERAQTRWPFVVCVCRCKVDNVSAAGLKGLCVRPWGGWMGGWVQGEIAKHCEAALNDYGLLCCSLFTISRFGSRAAKCSGMDSQAVVSDQCAHCATLTTSCNLDNLLWFDIDFQNGHGWIAFQARKKLEEVQSSTVTLKVASSYGLGAAGRNEEMFVWRLFLRWRWLGGFNRQQRLYGSRKKCGWTRMQVGWTKTQTNTKQIRTDQVCDWWACRGRFLTEVSLNSLPRAASWKLDLEKSFSSKRSRRTKDQDSSSHKLKASEFCKHPKTFECLLLGTRHLSLMYDWMPSVVV